MHVGGRNVRGVSTTDHHHHHGSAVHVSRISITLKKYFGFLNKFWSSSQLIDNCSDAIKKKNKQTNPIAEYVRDDRDFFFLNKAVSPRRKVYNNSCFQFFFFFGSFVRNSWNICGPSKFNKNKNVKAILKILKNRIYIMCKKKIIIIKVLNLWDNKLNKLWKIKYILQPV